VGNQSLFGRNADAKFFIPTEDEWYKAAYHDKNSVLIGNYFDYPTGTNSVPGNSPSDASGNNANYFTNHDSIGSPYYRTVGGEYQASDSPYGTFDQAGNVFEWNETAVGGSRGLRGGGFKANGSFLKASTRLFYVPTFEDYQFGFRVAAPAVVPEPGCVTLAVLVLILFATFRGRRRKYSAYKTL
jgi:formylglycine-generating enzyme required for sulfatase activity